MKSAPTSRAREYFRQHHWGMIATFLLLAGGTAWANHPGGANTISSTDIIDGQVRTADIDNTNGVRSADVRDDTLDGGGLTAIDLAPGSVGGSEIATGAVGSAAVLDDSLQSNDIEAGSIGASELAADAVTSPAVLDGSLLGADLAFETVGTADLANLGVTRAKIADGAVNNAKVAAFSLLNGSIASAAINNRTLATGAVNSRAILDSAVTGADVAANTLTSDDINEPNVSGLDRCPTPATARFGKICAGSDGTNRTWVQAVGFCADLGLRLPTLGEALMLALGHNVPGVSTGLFWTDGLYEEGLSVPAWIVNENGQFKAGAQTAFHETVCVVPPFN